MELARGGLVCASAPERPGSANVAMATSVMNRMRFIGILLVLADSWIALIGRAFLTLQLIAYAGAWGRFRAGGRDRNRRECGFTLTICRRMRYSWGALAGKLRRAVSATAVTLSDRIARLSNQLVFGDTGTVPRA